VLAGEFSFFQAGFDPAWKKLSPGKVLIGMVMEESAAQNIRVFDFLGGSDEYKQFWATGSRPMVSLVGFSSTLSGSAVRLALHARQAIKAIWLRMRSSTSKRSDVA
jgi:CelD/BcsL family acetyltransferase involved in cellulose biosynthesis